MNFKSLTNFWQIKKKNNLGFFLGRLLLWLFAGYLVLLVSARFVSSISYITNHNLYLTDDEVMSAEPANRVYEFGYRGFRCAESNLNFICYGGTMPLVDAALLNIFPKNWLSANLQSVVAPRPYPWVLAKPRQATVLRIFRIAIAFALLVSFWILGSSIPILPKIILIGGFGSSSIFWLTWQGLKNDYPSAMGLVWFCFFVWQGFSHKELLKSRWYKVGFILLGVLLTCIRLSNLVTFGVLGLALMVWEKVHLKKKYPEFIGNWLLASLIGVIGYFLINPGFLVRQAELQWFVQHLRFGVKASATLDGLIQEMQYFLPCLIFETGLALDFYLVKEKFHRGEKFGILALLASSLISLLLVFKLASLNFHYYFQGLTVLIFIAVLILNRAPQFAQWSIVALFVCSFTFSHLSESTSFEIASHGKTIGKPNPYLSERFHAATLHGILFVDVNMQAAAPVEVIRSTKAYDSLTESPFEVLAKAKAAGSATKVWIPCWGPSEEMSQWISSSSAIADWIQLAKATCDQLEPLKRAHLRTYTTSVWLPLFREVDLAEFDGAVTKAKISINSFRLGENLFPNRLWRGGWFGVDTWSGLHIFDNDVELSQNLNVTDKSFLMKHESILIPTYSSCLGDVKISATVNSYSKVQDVSARNSALDHRRLRLLRSHPRIFEFFAKWWDKLYELKPVELPLMSQFKEGKPLNISLKIHFANAKCRVALGQMLWSN